MSTLCLAFSVHRSSYFYWLSSSKNINADTLALEIEVKAIHAESNGSAGARTIASIATEREFPLSRYRAAKLMKKLEL
ncbi:IS3 family transposase, partial [Shewanella sairae]|nr:IS3 family transposase [Shewanella sairae]